MSGYVRITHRPTGLLLAEGPLGWGITPFEGNYYISKKYLRTDQFKPNFTPGICPYKLLYVWMDLHLQNGSAEKNLGWLYWLPNPLLPFIWFRVTLPGSHPSLLVERFAGAQEELVLGTGNKRVSSAFNSKMERHAEKSNPL